MTFLTELSQWEARVNILMWLFLLGMLMFTMGWSGLIDAKFHAAKHAGPPYRGRRRAPSWWSSKVRR